MPAPDLLVYLGAAAILKYTAMYLMSNRRPKTSKRVGHVSGLNVFPVKSSKGIPVDSVQLTTQGSLHDDVMDRTWMVMADNHGRFVTQRQEPTLSLVIPSIHGDELHLSAPDMPLLKLNLNLKPGSSKVLSVKVWGEALQALDCGTEASKWISKYLKQDNCHIVFAAPGLEKRIVAEGTAAPKYQRRAPANALAAFPDLTPYHLLGESSVSDLNSRIQGQKVTIEHFRPNIIVQDTIPYQEDDWEFVYIGEAVLQNIKLTDRCLLTTVDPSRGKKREDGEPLATLRKYRLLVPEFKNSPCFGINLVLVKPGIVRIGDEIYATTCTTST